MASLLTLPLELLIAVSVYLPTPDLSALRLTCKQVEKSLYEWFSKEFFTKKQFMLTEKSLQAFIDISKHVSFSKKLTNVIIGTDVYSDNIAAFTDDQAAACWAQGYQDQKALTKFGIDYEMLVEAFQNLENLQTVGFRDFNNNKRYRDGIGASWTSYGSTTVRKETGIPLQFSHDWEDFVPRLFQILIRALGKAKAHPEEFEVLLRHGFLVDAAFHLPDFALPTFIPVLQDLKKLYLAADVGSGQSAFISGGGNSTMRRNGYSLGRFLSHTPNLTHLRLNLQHYQFVNNTDFLKWLSKPKSASGGSAMTFCEPAPVELSHLISLEFGQFQVEPATILGAVAKFAPTLRELSLWRLTLADPTTVQRHDAKPNRWVGLFANLAKLPQLQLSFLKVGLLKQDHNKVSFKVAGRDDAPLEGIREHSGPKMDAFLQDLMEETVVQWPTEIIVDSDDGDDDEFNEDEMEVDDEDEEEDGDDDDED